jgi:hypothetical protein
VPENSGTVRGVRSPPTDPDRLASCSELLVRSAHSSPPDDVESNRPV